MEALHTLNQNNALEKVNSHRFLAFFNKLRKVGTGTQADLRFCRLPVQPQKGQGQTHFGMVADSKLKKSGASHKPLLSGRANHAVHR